MNRKMRDKWLRPFHESLKGLYNAGLNPRAAYGETVGAAETIAATLRHRGSEMDKVFARLKTEYQMSGLDPTAFDAEVDRVRDELVSAEGVFLEFADHFRSRAKGPGPYGPMYYDMEEWLRSVT